MVYLNQAKLKIALLGLAQTGKSAIVVRFLTGRYISEYSSKTDFLYKHTVSVRQGSEVDLEILDTSESLTSPPLPILEHINWANAFVVVYSVTDEQSFHYANKLLQTILMLKASQPFVTILMANKVDLAEHSRKVSTQSGQDLSEKYDCSFHEVSAAQNYWDILFAFKSLIEQSRPLLMRREHMFEEKRTNPSRTVSQVFAKIFSRIGKNRLKNKHKSLSI